MEQGIISGTDTLHVGTLGMMRLYLVINQWVTWAGMGVNPPLFADGDKDDGPNPFVLSNVMGGAFDSYLGSRALAMAGYVHRF